MEDLHGTSELTGDRPGNFHKHPYLTFSIFFCVTAALVFAPYYLNGRTLIANADAIRQHYPALVYYGEYLRKILYNIFIAHSFDIPTWDLSIGYGGDIITTLHYYGLGDPLNLLSVFFPGEAMEICYSLLIVLRLYLSGLSFLYFCRYRKLDADYSILGALSYCFSGYAITAGVFHPFFAIPMMYLPLLLLGVEQIYSKKSPGIFIASVALSALSNFYFFYMLVMIVVLYTIVRYFSYFPQFRLGECMRCVLRFLACGMIGMMIAAPVLLPNLHSLLQLDRISAARQIALFYESEYYALIPAATISYYDMHYYSVAISSVAMLAVFALIVTPKKQHTTLKFSLAALFVCTLIPRIGSVFNGFNYATNRFIWALIFVISYIAAAVFPTTERLSSTQKRVAAGICFFFCFLCLIPSLAHRGKTYAAVLFLLMGLVFMMLINARRIGRCVYRTGIISLTVAAIVVNGYYWAAPEKGNWAGKSIAAGEAYSIFCDSSAARVAELPSSEISRFDQVTNRIENNTAMLCGANGTSCYFSTINPGTASFQRSQMLNESIGQQYRGLDGRSYLAAALSVSYFLTDSNTDIIPFGYDIPAGNGETEIYTSDHVLPLVYAFDYVYSDGELLSVTERQQLLLQCAVTDEDFGLPEGQPSFSDQTLVIREVCSDGVIRTDEGFLVTKDNATVTFEFDGVERSELYLIFTDLDFAPDDPGLTDISLKASCGGVTRPLRYRTAYDNFYCGYHDFLVNLGYKDYVRNRIVITLPAAGVYSFSDASVVAQPMDDFEAQVDALADSGISQISVDGDVISFHSERKTPGMACIAIPYQDGWTAFIDGEPTAICSVQNGLCGVFLPEGTHNVVLSYHTPLFRVGMVLSVIGIVLAVITVIKNRRSHPPCAKKQF